MLSDVVADHRDDDQIEHDHAVNCLQNAVDGGQPSTHSGGMASGAGRNCALDYPYQLMRLVVVVVVEEVR